MRPLGERQKRVMQTMAECGGSWHYGAGWKWGTPSETDAVLRSLAARGLINQTVDRDAYGTGVYEMSKDMIQTLTGGRRGR